jgi:hypothetical protein
MKHHLLFAAFVSMSLTTWAAQARANPLDVQQAPPQARFDEGQRWFFALPVGTGAGYVGGRLGLTPGFHMAAGLHVSPELGYFITPRVSLSVQVREQFASDLQAAQLTSGLTLLGRLSYWFGEGRLQTRVSVFGGNGTYFHQVSGPCVMGGGICTGSARSGDKIVGTGLALSYALTRTIAATAGLDVAVGIPNRMLNTDVSAGLAFRF